MFITLNKLKNPPQFKVSVRSIRDRYTPLTKKFRKRMTSEQKASGISPEMSELDVLMEELTGMEDLSEEECGGADIYLRLRGSSNIFTYS